MIKIQGRTSLFTHLITRYLLLLWNVLCWRESLVWTQLWIKIIWTRER